MSGLTVRPDEHVVIAGNGDVLREYDDVVLLRDVPSCAAGSVEVDVIRAGTRGTIIIMLDGNRVEIECDVDVGKFAFAQEDAGQLRLVRRREEKLKDA